jgi:glycosyltransferase involved in cell wall biosynthesis
MNTSLVTVVIPVYNRERFIRGCLESVFRQTYRPIQVIVVNDGSTDNSAGIVREFGHDVTLICQENHGLSAARNAGIALASGEWIALLDPDDLWDSCKLEHQLSEALVEDDVLYSRFRTIDANGTLLSENLKNPKSDGPAPLSLAALLGRNYLHAGGSTAVVRKRRGDAVGWFDASNRYGWEDWQLWLSLACTCGRFRLIDEVLASYRRHDKNMSSGSLRMARGRLHAFECTRRKYPQAFGRPELEVYRSQLYRNYSILAHALFRAGEYGASAPYFWRAALGQRTDLGLWLRAAAASLPCRKTILPTLRKMVQRLKGG